MVFFFRAYSEITSVHFLVFSPPHRVSDSHAFFFLMSPAVTLTRIYMSESSLMPPLIQVVYFWSFSLHRQRMGSLVFFFPFSETSSFFILFRHEASSSCPVLFLFFFYALLDHQYPLVLPFAARVSMFYLEPARTSFCALVELD